MKIYQGYGQLKSLGSKRAIPEFEVESTWKQWNKRRLGGGRNGSVEKKGSFRVFPSPSRRESRTARGRGTFRGSRASTTIARWAW